MTNNNGFLKFACCIGISWLLFGCSGTEVQPPTPPQTAVEETKNTPDHYANIAIKKLKPHLEFLDEKSLDETANNYRKIYLAFLNRYPEQSMQEKVQSLMEMVDETSQNLDSKDEKGKKCVIERDFISADLMPLLGEIETLYKRHLSKIQLTLPEFEGVREKVKTLNALEPKIAKLCRPFRDTLKLLNNEARLDAGYILDENPKTSPDTVEELLNDGTSSDK